MASLPSAENRGGHGMTRDLKWSHAEKSIARNAFDCALDREFEAVIRNTQGDGRQDKKSGFKD